MTGASLAGPLARALDDFMLSDADDLPAILIAGDTTEAAEVLLTRLREMPEVLAAMAEALHDITPVEKDGGVPDVCNLWPEHEKQAAAILDELLGAGSAAEGAEK